MKGNIPEIKLREWEHEHSEEKTITMHTKAAERQRKKEKEKEHQKCHTTKGSEDEPLETGRGEKQKRITERTMEMIQKSKMEKGKSTRRENPTGMKKKKTDSKEK